MLDGEGINGAIMTSLCDVWFRVRNEEAVHVDNLYRALHLVICDCHDVERENFMHKYNDFYLTSTFPWRKSWLMRSLRV
jgi:hypothetical protein